MLNSILTFVGDWWWVLCLCSLSYALGATIHNGPVEIHHIHFLDTRAVEQWPWVAPQEDASHEC